MYRWVFSDDLKLSILSVGSRRKSGTDYPDRRTARRRRESFTTKTCCGGWMIASALRWRLDTSEVDMQTQIRAKNSLTYVTSLTSRLYQLVFSWVDVYAMTYIDWCIRQHGRDGKVHDFPYLHCALASCGAVYCNRSCLWVCDSGRAVFLSLSFALRVEPNECILVSKI